MFETWMKPGRGAASAAAPSTSTRPGQKLKTRTLAPAFRTWSRTDSAKPSSACFDAQYEGTSAYPCLPACEETFTTSPKSCLDIDGSAARTSHIAPFTFVSETLSQPSSVISSTV